MKLTLAPSSLLNSGLVVGSVAAFEEEDEEAVSVGGGGGEAGCMGCGAKTRPPRLATGSLCATSGLVRLLCMARQLGLAQWLQ